MNRHQACAVFDRYDILDSPTWVFRCARWVSPSPGTGASPVRSEPNGLRNDRDWEGVRVVPFV